MTIKQLGGVFGRNPTFNDVTIEGQLTFDGDIDINSDLTVDGEVTADGVNISQLTGATLKIESTGPGLGAGSSIGKIDFFGNDASAPGPGVKASIEALTEASLGDDGALVFRTSSGTANNIETARLRAGVGLVLPSGYGIDFSATGTGTGTSTSELFDDYEEGTFTPVLADATSGGNEASVLSAYGYYTKVGRVVTVTISITNPNTTGLTATNNVYITGLPFSAFSLAGGIYYTAPLAGGGNFATAGTYLGSVGDNLSYMTILKADFGGSTTFQKVSAINTGVTDIVTSLSYFA
jgi:hypothetical protein